MMNIIGLVVSFAYVFFILYFAKVFTKYGEEVSRKFAHIMLGNWWFIAIIFFDNAIWASIGPVCFIILNYISYKKNLFKSIERSDNKEQGLGTVYYAIALFITVIITFEILKVPTFGLIPIMMMAYGDGFAAIVGKKIKSKKYKIFNCEKTVAGSITMFVVSFALTLACLYVVGVPYWGLKALILSLIATIFEAISIKGTDNLTVPLAVVCTMFFM